VTGYDLTGMYKWTFGWVSGTIHLNKNETARTTRAAQFIGFINGAAGIFALTGIPGLLAKWVALNAAGVAWKAAGANSRHHCVKLKWPIGYPGLLSGEYSGGYCR